MFFSVYVVSCSGSSGFAYRGTPAFRPLAVGNRLRFTEPFACMKVLLSLASRLKSHFLQKEQFTAKSHGQFLESLPCFEYGQCTCMQTAN